MGKGNRVRQVKPPLIEKGARINQVNWRDQLPELLLIVGLLEDRSVREVLGILMRLRQVFGGHPILENRTFSGRVSDLGRCVDAEGSLSEEARDALRTVYSGPNAALLRLLPVPGAASIGWALEPAPDDPTRDPMTLMRMVAKAQDPRGGRATRAKFVEACLLGAEETMPPSEWTRVKSLLDSGPDDTIAAEAGSLARPAWLALLGVEGPRSDEWQGLFWILSARRSPCFVEPGRTVAETVELDDELACIVNAIDETWGAIVKLQPARDLFFVGEVILGLMSRVWRMMHHIIALSGNGRGEMVEIAVRCQADTFITLLWLLRANDPKLMLRFQEYSSGKSKRALEYTRGLAGQVPDELRRTIEGDLQGEVHSAGTWEQLVPAEKGQWTDKSTAQMAEDIGRSVEYEMVFARASDVVHGTWRSITRWSMVRCINPLHQNHWIPDVGPTCDAGTLPIVGATSFTSDALLEVARTLLGPKNELTRKAGALREELKGILAKRKPEEGFRKQAECRDSRAEGEDE